MHRFFIPRESIENEAIIFSKLQQHQIINVLRMSDGDRVKVFPNTGWEYLVELKRPSKGKLNGVILEGDFQEFQPGVKLILFVSPLKKENFGWILQKCTEIGVYQFVPTVFARTIRIPEDNEKTYNRWANITIEASEQSGRRYLPLISKMNTFESAIIDSMDFDACIIPWEKEKTISSFLDTSNSKKTETMGLFIGPEGGITNEEIEFARMHNSHIVSLGNNILRSETAAIVASSYLIANTWNL